MRSHYVGSLLKRRIAITFIDEFGLEEAGIDGGGVFKEFLTKLVNVLCIYSHVLTRIRFEG